MRQIQNPNEASDSIRHRAQKELAVLSAEWVGISYRILSQMLRESSQENQKVRIGRAGPSGALLKTFVIWPFFLLSAQA
jgi:hypothetical protein